MEITTGAEPAFPLHGQSADFKPGLDLSGLTKLEVFSAVALHGLLQNTANMPAEVVGAITAAHLARQAASCARALVAELGLS